MNKIKKSVFGYAGLLAVAGMLWLTGYSPTPPDDHYFEIAKQIDIFGKILREIDNNYVDDIDPATFVRTGVDKMLSSLDPYTQFISASEIEDYQFLSTGQYGGIGAMISKRDKKFIVTEVYEGKAADKAGLKPGDEILQVDSEVLSPSKFETLDIRNLLRGQPGTSLSLRIRRYGKTEPMAIDVQREDIKVGNVQYSGFVSDDIGYIALTGFTKDANQEVKDAYQRLKAQNAGMKGLVLDLRGNPGGLLYEAINISNLFVNKGEKIVETKGKMEGSYKRYDAENSPLDLDIPLAVMINGGSASASEIVSGVMQDLDRGVIVGRRSFGKGLVQTTRPLSYKTQLKVTTARYYTPSGRCIQAIDYSQREKNGSVKRTSDSLKVKYSTRNGRTVMDAGGIDPDLEVEDEEVHKITRDLVKDDLIFDYATKYYHTHAEVPAIRDFKITDQVYEDFVAFVKDKGFVYENYYSEELTNLDSLLKKEAYYSQVSSSLKNLRAEIEQYRTNDIHAYKDEIGRLLRYEILLRYHYEKGRIETALTDDPDVAEAVKVLKDQERYRKLLAGNKK